MGVLTDYFRAPDAETAVRAMSECDGSLGPPLPFERVEAKGIDPHVVLGQLMALAGGVPWEPRLVPTTLVWPSRPIEASDKESFDALPDESPLKSGPWLEELGVSVRDALAAIDETRLPELAAQWATIDEFHGLAQVDELLPLLNELVGLARRARDARDRLYCWICL